MNNTKITHGIANVFFRAILKKTPLAKILRPNLWAKHDPMVILSLSTFRGKVRFDCIFSIEIPLFHGKPLSHVKPSGIYFEGFLFSSEYFLCYYYFLFLAPRPWLPGCSAKLLKNMFKAFSQSAAGQITFFKHFAGISK